LYKKTESGDCDPQELGGFPDGFRIARTESDQLCVISPQTKAGGAEQIHTAGFDVIHVGRPTKSYTYYGKLRGCGMRFGLITMLAQ
jgi:hypothetical protein